MDDEAFEDDGETFASDDDETFPSEEQADQDADHDTEMDTEGPLCSLCGVQWFTVTCQGASPTENRKQKRKKTMNL